MWNAHSLRPVFLSAGVFACAAVVAATAGCRDEPGLTGQITADGSSTVFPLTTAITDDFLKAHPGVKISVAISGTGGGFEKFCRGETDIQNASRPIDERERAACDSTGVAFLEVPVAYDALTIIVHPSNTWARSMTVAELKKLWEPSAQGKVMKWADIRPGWPADHRYRMIVNQAAAARAAAVRTWFHAVQLVT